MAEDNNNDMQEKSTNFTSKVIKFLWWGFGICFVLFFFFFILIYNGWVGYMPPIEELKNPQDKYASVVYSCDGEELGRYFRNTGNRVYADYEDISPYVIQALIATEDSRFEDHSGIDMRAMCRVFVKTLILQQKNAGGGSTITQQLAKQLYSPSSDNIIERAIQKMKLSRCISINLTFSIMQLVLNLLHTSILAKMLMTSILKRLQCL